MACRHCPQTGGNVSVRSPTESDSTPGRLAFRLSRGLELTLGAEMAHALLRASALVQ